MNVSVIGAGYVGLITAAGLAEIGHRVIAVDDDARKIEVLNSGGMPFYEPILGDLVKRNQQAKRLEFNSKIEDAVTKCQVVFICVGTPPSRVVKRTFPPWSWWREESPNMPVATSW